MKKSAAVSHKRKLNQESDLLCELVQKYTQYPSQTGYEKDNWLPKNILLIIRITTITEDYADVRFCINLVKSNNII